MVVKKRKEKKVFLWADIHICTRVILYNHWKKGNSTIAASGRSLALVEVKEGRVT